MSITFTGLDLLYLILIAITLIVISKLVKKFIFPILAIKTTKPIETNPRWIEERIRKKYYGFHDVDIVTVDSSFGQLPRFQLTKNDRLQLLISPDTPVDDVEKLAHLALAGKLKIYHNLWFPDKSINWLSMLCYLLDGGDVNEEAITWETIDKK